MLCFASVGQVAIIIEILLSIVSHGLHGFCTLCDNPAHTCDASQVQSAQWNHVPQMYCCMREFSQ